MPVKIKKKHKERNTPLWTFLGIALIPLLLTYFAGFSSAKTVDKDKANWRETAIDFSRQLEQKDSTILVLEKRISLYAKVNKGLDLDFEKLKNEANEVTEKLGQAYATGNKFEIDNWYSEEYLGLNRNWRKQLNQYRADYDQDSILVHSIKLLDNSLTELLARINSRQLMEIQKLSTLDSDAITGQLQDLEVEQLKLDHRKAISDKDDEIKNLKDQLKNANKGEDPCEQLKIQNNKQTTVIADAVEQVRNEVLPNMKVGFLKNNRKKIEELAKSLRVHLSAISDATNEIQ